MVWRMRMALLLAAGRLGGHVLGTGGAGAAGGRGGAGRGRGPGGRAAAARGAAGGGADGRLDERVLRGHRGEELVAGDVVLNFYKILGHVAELDRVALQLDDPAP